MIFELYFLFNVIAESKLCDSRMNFEGGGRKRK